MIPLFYLLAGGSGERETRERVSGENEEKEIGGVVVAERWREKER